MNTIALPRSVVEQALQAFAFAYNACKSDWVLDEKIDPAMKLLETALEQPQGEQEPVAYYVMNGAALFQLFRSKSQADALAYDLQKRHDLSGSLAHFHVVPLYTHPQNLNCKSNQARLATLWGYEKPQPRQPLTDELIDKIADGMPGGLDGFMKGWGWRQFARAVEAHGIGGAA